MLSYSYSSFLFAIGERRGVGGIFFDDVDEPSQDKCFNFVKVSVY